MVRDLPIFLLALFVLAIFFRNDIFFYVLYLFAGLYVAGRWWTGRVSRALWVRRAGDQRLFLGEQRPVTVEIHNRSLLPVPWLTVADRIPPELLDDLPPLRSVVSLGAQATQTLRYEIRATRRGYYQLGPLRLQVGDLLGTGLAQEQESTTDGVIVYPKIIPMPRLSPSSRTPLGSLRHRQRLYEDPTRLVGTRDYQPGDPWRRIHWSASAAAGQWQVKLYDPAISVGLGLLLNLNEAEYPVSRWRDSSELAITAAASIAFAVIGLGQSVGVAVNGVDPMAADRRPVPIPPRSGQSHLMLMLELLARVALGPSPMPFAEFVRSAATHLPWGATVVAITASPDPSLLAAAYGLRRAGYEVFLVLTHVPTAPQQVKAQAAAYGLGVLIAEDEADLARWDGHS